MRLSRSARGAKNARMDLPVHRLVRLRLVSAVLLVACQGRGREANHGATANPARAPWEIDTAEGRVRVSALSGGAFHVRLSRHPEEGMRDALRAPPPEWGSFAVDPAALTPAPYSVDTSDPGRVVVRAGGAALQIKRSPLQLALLDAAGQVVAQEAAPVAWEREGASLAWQLAEGEHVYGLGDKAGGFDRRGHAFQLWNYDAYGWTPASDPLYKSIPFLIFLHDGRAHALFIDNASRAQLDVGAADPGRLAYHAERAPALDLYLFPGPDAKAILGAYSALTGRTPLPPRWALGYHQCRYSYASEQDARTVAARLDADGIPVDVIWLDIDYQDGYAPFTVNRAAFPNFAAMISDFAATGLNTVLITDPHIPRRPGYAPYDEGSRGDHFVRMPDGELFIGRVWPGMSVFPEFTLSRTRAWWGRLYRQFVDDGAAGFWNDMNEPALLGQPKTMPDVVVHRLDDGRTLDHVAVHNAYGHLNARATYEGVLALRPDRRPFVLTRAAYAGTQRWAATWTGDNSATREHLAFTIPQLSNLGVSGYAFAGADVGGFLGCPYTEADPALLAEWIELGALQPFFRNHSGRDTCRREPWVQGAALEQRIRAAIERRYRLLPYLYTLFEESSRTGLPVMRPLWLEYPNDPAAATNDRAFLLGRDLLIAPKLAAASGPYEVTLPAAPWWDTITGELLAAGGQVTISPAADDSLRIFARAGAIVPSQPVARRAGAPPEGALSLDVWPGDDCGGALYLDEGEGFGYQRGELRRVAYTCQASARGMQISARSSGAFPPWWSATRVVIHGARPPVSLDVERGASPAWSYDPALRTLTVTLSGADSDWRLGVSWP